MTGCLKLNMHGPGQYTLSMNHATMHYSGHDAVVQVIHLQCDTLQHRRELSSEYLWHRHIDLKKNKKNPHTPPECPEINKRHVNVYPSSTHTMGSSVFFWNCTRRTRVTFSRSMSPLVLSGESPFKYGEVGGGVTLSASSLYTS